MIDEPLAPRWQYDLGNRKIYEFRAALGLSPEGPAPRGAVFAYGVVPGLARVLTHPHIASHRSELRMSRLEVVFASELNMRGELACEIGIEPGDSVLASLSCRDEREARVVATVHLTPDDAYVPSPRVPEAEKMGELRLDPARCVAFAAATWDLNPAYWDAPFADAAGLGGTIVPPGLPVALAVEMIEGALDRSLAALDVVFDRAARPGDRVDLNAAVGGRDVWFEVVSEDGTVLSGRGMFGSDPRHL